jgi:hypothetical protein
VRSKSVFQPFPWLVLLFLTGMVEALWGIPRIVLRLGVRGLLTLATGGALWSSGLLSPDWAANRGVRRNASTDARTLDRRRGGSSCVHLRTPVTLASGPLASAADTRVTHGLRQIRYVRAGETESATEVCRISRRSLERSRFSDSLEPTICLGLPVLTRSVRETTMA